MGDPLGTLVRSHSPPFHCHPMTKSIHCGPQVHLMRTASHANVASCFKSPTTPTNIAHPQPSSNLPKRYNRQCEPNEKCPARHQHLYCCLLQRQRTATPRLSPCSHCHSTDTRNRGSSSGMYYDATKACKQTSKVHVLIRRLLCSANELRGSVCAYKKTWVRDLKRWKGVRT